MRLQAGTRLGSYEVISAIGAGGMGEVYRARDTRLDRAVAIKVLTPELAADPEFRERFTREAKAISSINHRHICALYDVGREQEGDYLVFELLEGETLAAHLERGPMPIGQVLRIGIEISDALEAAHRRGLVHRDLKPGNIMLTPAGTKLLDFGLAKQTPAAGYQADSTLPAVLDTATAAGSFMGTPQYMAPEQVLGQQVDTRTDLFAFGAVLYEMATGRKAFEGSTPIGVLSKILEGDPPPLTPHIRSAIPALDNVIRVCLAKDRSERWQSAHDILVQLRWIQQQSAAGPPADSGPRRREWISWGVAAVAFAIAILSIVRPAKVVGRPATPSRTEILLPPRLWLHEYADFPAISPDGRTIAFAGVADGVRRLYIRPVGSAGVQPLPNTDGAYAPFWSADGRAVGFFVGDSVRRVAVDDGRVVTIGSYAAKGMLQLRRGTTNGDGTVLIADGDAVWRAGQRITAPGGDRPADTSARIQYPQFLPDGQRFLYFARGKPGLYVGSLASGESKAIGDVPSPAQYAAGHLLYTRGRTLMARPVDPVQLSWRGTEIPIADGIVESHFSAAVDGTIVYRTTESELAALVWFNRSGARLGALGDLAEYRHVALSPSGRRVAVSRGDPSSVDLWTADSTSGVFTRVTTASGAETDPTWSPDERFLAYSYMVSTDVANETRQPGVRRLDLATGADMEFVTATCRNIDDWTRDGRVICRQANTLSAVPGSGTGKATALSDSGGTDQSHVSPNGSCIAYNSRASGEWEVYLAPLSGMASATRVSTAGGVQPLWSGDGRELFFMTLDGTVMSVAARTAPRCETDTPRPLFKTGLVPAEGWSQYAVTPDGQRFLIKEPVRQFFTLLQNWLPSQLEGR